MLTGRGVVSPVPRSSKKGRAAVVSGATSDGVGFGFVADRCRSNSIPKSNAAASRAKITSPTAPSAIRPFRRLRSRRRCRSSKEYVGVPPRFICSRTSV
jgi:hypothetical protein